MTTFVALSTSSRKGELIMLQQPMKEKLCALKLQGMAQALEHQEQDEAARELSFIDRLALLVDQQWNWRQNQALTRRVLAARLRERPALRISTIVPSED